VHIYWQFNSDQTSNRILKMDQRLPKVWSEVKRCTIFQTYSVNCTTNKNLKLVDFKRLSGKKKTSIF